MDFEFTAEQEELRASVRRFLFQRAPLTYVRAMYDEPIGTSPELWTGLVDLGVLDRDLTMTDIGVVLEEMGRAVHPGPYLSTLAARWAGLDDDSVVATLAVDPRRVPDAMAADVVVMVDGEDLYVVDDFDAVPAASVDGSRKVGAITVNTRGRKIDHPDLRGALDRWKIGYAIDGVGAASVALEMAVAYSQERVQFDRPIGSFQAVQHLCADMLTALELGRAGAYYALWAADNESAAEVHRAATMAIAYASDAFHRIGADAIQVFGGVGYTWEHDIHLFYKRLLTVQHTFGTAPTHLEELMKVVLASPTSQ